MHTQSIVRNNANTNIARAWERFADSGAINPNAIRKVIGNSWIKSRELGIQTDIAHAPTVITTEEIAELQRTTDLVLASKPVLCKFEQTLAETEHVVVLADADSRILYSTGHKPIQDKLEKINFRPGAEWSEQLVGPNGVGTSLALGRPEIVMGYEHYCKAWQPWVCYGAPIYDATGTKIKGTLDITGPVDQMSKQSMAMAIALAQSVGANLAIEQFRTRERLREHGKALLQKWPADSVLILDESANIIDFNTKASQLYQHTGKDMLNRPVYNFLPGLHDALAECTTSHSAVSIEIHNIENPDLHETSQVNIEAITDGGKCLGVVLVLEMHKNSIVLPEIVMGHAHGLHALGDEVIQKTLVKTNYNISKAAKMLGIDRTTIYRRMRKWS